MKRTFKVFVGTDKAGNPHTWTCAARRRDCRHYIREWLGDAFSDADVDAVPIRRATLTLTPPKPKPRRQRR